MAGGFDANTRRRVQKIGPFIRPAADDGLVQSIELPRVGFLARIWLQILGTVSGTLSNENAKGLSSIIRRVSLIANDGPRLFNMSGAGYHWMLLDYLDLEAQALGSYYTGRNPVVAGTYDISMMIPLQVNRRDPVGLLRMASNVNTYRLEVEWASRATVATGAGITGVATPTLEFFTIPDDPADWPETWDTLSHVIMEESIDVAASGEFRYAWPRQNIYLQMLHGMGFGVAGADAVDSISWVVNRQDYVEQVDPAFKGFEFGFWHGRSRPPGTFAFDLIGATGLGDYGTMRDTFDSKSFTDVETVLNVTTPGTLTTVRRQLVRLRPDR